LLNDTITGDIIRIILDFNLLTIEYQVNGVTCQRWVNGKQKNITIPMQIEGISSKPLQLSVFLMHQSPGTVVQLIAPLPDIIEPKPLISSLTVATSTPASAAISITTTTSSDTMTTLASELTPSVRAKYGPFAPVIEPHQHEETKKVEGRTENDQQQSVAVGDIVPSQEAEVKSVKQLINDLPEQRNDITPDDPSSSIYPAAPTTALHPVVVMTTSSMATNVPIDIHDNVANVPSSTSLYPSAPSTLNAIVISPIAGAPTPTDLRL
jgi:hypothetical protein